MTGLVTLLSAHRCGYSPRLVQLRDLPKCITRLLGVVDQRQKLDGVSILTRRLTVT
jgi:hypothetical protein